MIFEPQRYSFIFQDAIYSITIGFLTGFINQLFSVFLYKGKIRVFIKDIMISFIFAVLLYSYSVSFTNYNVLRWYNVVMALAGLVLFTPCFDLLGRTVINLLQVTIKHFFSRTIKIIKRKAEDIHKKSAEKRQKLPQKNDGEVLKPDDKMLYN